LLALKLDVVTLPDCALWTVLTMPDATPMQGVVAVDSERLRYEVLALKDASPPHVWAGRQDRAQRVAHRDRARPQTGEDMAGAMSDDSPRARLDWFEAQADWHHAAWTLAMDRRDSSRAWHFSQYRWYGRQAHRIRLAFLRPFPIERV
jgi:hypothetical protein